MRATLLKVHLVLAPLQLVTGIMLWLRRQGRR